MNTDKFHKKPDQLRPDPDRLLDDINREYGKTSRGHLKIFLAYAAGAGKTYAMLDAAHEMKKAGIDVVVGYIEPHNRPETLALMEDLEPIEPKTVRYKDIKLLEFDLDSALKRNPQLIVIDELAHTNAEGSRHHKRWQDVEELLFAGIDVYTTINIQHIESLNDVVASITHIYVKETVPDSFFDNANQVELVDIDPEDLLKRFEEGKVYGKEQAKRAKYHFFTRKNLDALRELALRRMAERVNREIESERLSKGELSVLPASEQIMACISPSESSARVIRSAARMAEAFQAKWTAFYVETSAATKLRDYERARLRLNIKLAEQLGAEIVLVSGEDVVEQIIKYAKLLNITKIVIGKNQAIRGRLWRVGARSIADGLIGSIENSDIHVIPGIPAENKRVILPSLDIPFSEFKTSVSDVIKTAGIMTLATLLSFVFIKIGFTYDNILMVYIIGVLLVSVSTSGYLMGIAASVFGMLCINYFFVEPLYTFSVYDSRYIVTFIVFLIMSLLTGTLTTKIQKQAQISSKREGYTQMVYQTGRSFLNIAGKQNIVLQGIKHIEGGLSRICLCYLPDEKNALENPVYSEDKDKEGIEMLLEKDEQAVAGWVFLNGKTAGAGTDTLPGANAVYLPITGQHGILGVVGISCIDGVVQPEQQSFLEAVISQMALALDRERLAEQQEKNKMQIETERIKTNLLRAISHDIRSPLTGISGASSTILENGDKLDAGTMQELLRGIHDDAEWLIRLVENLLSLTRIEEGKLEVKKNMEAVEEIVAEAVQRIKKLASSQKISVKIPDKLIMIPVDGKLIEQVLINLIDNALKYTPQDSIIEINVYKSGERVTFEVADNGPGLPEESIKNIFDTFFTAEHKFSDARRGVGLGLAICKSIVEAHGGTIEASNRVSGGALFKFTLPARFD